MMTVNENPGCVTYSWAPFFRQPCLERVVRSCWSQQQSSVEAGEQEVRKAQGRPFGTTNSGFPSVWLPTSWPRCLPQWHQVTLSPSNLNNSRLAPGCNLLCSGILIKSTIIQHSLWHLPQTALAAGLAAWARRASHLSCQQAFFSPS